MYAFTRSVSSLHARSVTYRNAIMMTYEDTEPELEQSDEVPAEIPGEAIKSIVEARCARLAH